MAYNSSPRQRSIKALNTRLRDLAGWHLAVECGTATCARQRTYDLRALSGCCPGVTLGEATRRMRCQRCGNPPVSAALTPWDEDLKRHGCVPVIGPGSW